MAKYLYVYHGGGVPDPEEVKQVMDAWEAWFRGIGASVVEEQCVAARCRKQKKPCPSPHSATHNHSIFRDREMRQGRNYPLVQIALWWGHGSKGIARLATSDGPSCS